MERENDRIECAIRHIETSLDVDPWACEIAVNAMKKLIEEPPRMRGRWEGVDYDGYADGCPVYYTWQCSACGCVVEDEEPTWNYCPNCGADMRGTE